MRSSTAAATSSSQVTAAHSPTVGDVAGPDRGDDDHADGMRAPCPVSSRRRTALLSSPDQGGSQVAAGPMPSRGSWSAGSPIGDAIQRRTHGGTCGRNHLRPGLSAGPTSEFSLFFRVKPGAGGAAGGARRPAGDTGVPARGSRHGHHHDPRGAIRAVRRRHPARLHHQLRRSLGRLHGGLLHLRTDARALRRDLRACGGLRRSPRPGRGEGVRLRRAADGGRLRTELRRHREGDPEGPAGERRVPAGAGPPGGGGGAATPGAAALLDEAAD